MDKERMAALEEIESHGAENGWVAPMTEEDREFFASASATERTRDFCGLFLLHIAKYAANRCIYSTNLSIPFSAAPL